MLVLPSLVGDKVGLFDHDRLRGDALRSQACSGPQTPCRRFPQGGPAACTTRYLPAG